MLGSNSISKNQKKNKNSSSTYTRGRKSKKNTYDVYDIEQSTQKNKRRIIRIKNVKSNEKINNIDIIEDIDKINNYENKKDENSEDKAISPPLSPISLTSDTQECVIEIPDITTTLEGDSIIVIDKQQKKSNSMSIDSSDEDSSNDDEIEIVKYIKYSSKPTVFETFTKNNILWCHYCGTTHTSSWRHGPWGKKSLCNKHGCDYKGYGFTVRQPRLDLSKFSKESSKRIRPVIQEFCCVCFSDKSNKDNALVMCNGCYRAYHQNCYPEKISSDIVNSDELFYCKEECRHTRENKKIETDLPRKNLPFMFNRGITGQRASKSEKIIPKIKLVDKSLEKKNKDKKSNEAIEITPASTPAPNSPTISSNSSSNTTSTSNESHELVEPEPKVLKSEITNIKSITLNHIKEQRHKKRGGLKEEDTIVLYTKNLPPIIGFQHEEIPLPSWEIHNEMDEDTYKKRKHDDDENEDDEMFEDISDEAYIKRHHPLELSEKYSRCGSLINTSKIDEEALNKIIEKQSKKRKLKKGYIYI